MSVEQFSKVAYFQIVNNASHYLGAYELPQDGDLYIMQLRVYHKKVGPYSYTMKVELAGSPTGPTLASSVVEEFSNDTTGQVGDDWLGHCVFSFEPYSLVAGDSYHFRLVTTGYTRPLIPNENTAYLAVACDWLEPLGVTDTAGARVALGVER